MGRTVDTDVLIDRINNLFSVLEKVCNSGSIRSAVAEIKEAVLYEINRPDLPKCQCDGCGNDAYIEGWHRALDGFGLSTGVLRKLQVCQEHSRLLIGVQEGKQP